MAPVWDEQVRAQFATFGSKTAGARAGVRVERAGAQASKLPAPTCTSTAHPDVPYHLGIFRPISLQKLLFCMQMFTYKADFGEKLALEMKRSK